MYYRSFLKIAREEFAFKGHHKTINSTATPYDGNFLTLPFRLATYSVVFNQITVVFHFSLLANFTRVVFSKVFDHLASKKLKELPNYCRGI